VDRTVWPIIRAGTVFFFVGVRHKAQRTRHSDDDAAGVLVIMPTDFGKKKGVPAMPGHESSDESDGYESDPEFEVELMQKLRGKVQCAPTHVCVFETRYPAAAS